MGPMTKAVFAWAESEGFVVSVRPDRDTCAIKLKVTLRDRGIEYPMDGSLIASGLSTSLHLGLFIRARHGQYKQPPFDKKFLSQFDGELENRMFFRERRDIFVNHESGDVTFTVHTGIRKCESESIPGHINDLLKYAGTVFKRDLNKLHKQFRSTIPKPRRGIRGATVKPVLDK